MFKLILQLAVCVFVCLLGAAAARATPVDVEWRYEIPELQTTVSGLVEFDTDDVIAGRVTAGHLTKTSATPSGSVFEEMELPWTIDQGSTPKDLLGFVYEPVTGKVGFTSIQSFLFILFPGSLGCVSPWESCELYAPDTGLITASNGTGVSQMRVYIIATLHCQPSPGCIGGTQHGGFGFQVPIVFRFVPEPSSLAMILFGVSAMGIRHRRQVRMMPRNLG